MRGKRANDMLTVYTIVFMLMAIAELVFDFEWINSIVQVIFYIVLLMFTLIVCRSSMKFDKRIELLIYIILISAAVLNKNSLIFLSGIAVIVFSLKQVNYTSRIVVILSTVMLIAISILLGLIHEKMVRERIMSEDISPDSKYVVEQVYQDAGETAVMVNLHRELFGVFDVSYRVRLNDEKSEIIWIDNNTFSIDGEYIRIKM